MEEPSDRRATSGRRARGRRATGAGARQAGDGHAAGRRQARAVLAEGGTPFSAAIILAWSGAAHVHPKKLTLAGYVTGYVLLLIEQVAYKRGVPGQKNGDRN